MVTYSSFHIKFGFSCKPKIKVVTAVLIKQPGQFLAKEHCLSIVLFLWLSVGGWVKTSVTTLIFGVQEKPNQI